MKYNSSEIIYHVHGYWKLFAKINDSTLLKKFCSETIVWWQFFQPTQIGIWIGNLNIPSFHSSTILTYLFYSLLYSNPRSGYSEIKILWWQFIKLHIFSGDWHFNRNTHIPFAFKCRLFTCTYNMHYVYIFKFSCLTYICIILL